MSTGAPDSRQTHVIRIVGTNKEGDVLQDIWADVERTDIEKHVTQMLNNDWQGRQRKLMWMDDPDSDNYNPDGNPARKTKIVKVCSPDEADVDNPEEWIPIPAIKSMKSLGYDGNDNTGTQGDFRTGIDDSGADPTVTTRVVEVRKIVHYDTNIDDAAQAAFDADSTRTAYVVKGSDYTRLDGSDGSDTTKDDSQFVDHEIIKSLKARTDENNPAGAVNRGVQTKLLNKYLIDRSDDPDGTVVGSSGINPPYRLGPYQTIINVQFLTDQQWLLGIEGPGGTFKARDKDGDTFSAVNTGASGNGFTVLTSGFITFGRGKFLRADLKGVVYLGRLVNGAFDWQAVFTAPLTGDGIIPASGKVVALSFANNLFFVSYAKFASDGSGYNVFLASSKDGINFVSGIKPFSNSKILAGGNVTYLRAVKRYVITASIVVNTDDASGFNNLVTSSSSEGEVWTSSFDGSSYGGIGRRSDVHTEQISTVAAGDGIFVAAASKKNRFPNSNPVLHAPDVVLHSCAVAVSTDGLIWSVIGLPGAVVRSSFTLGDLQGDTIEVLFVRDKAFSTSQPSPNNTTTNGYFVATGRENGDGFTRLNKMWTSSDGFTWTLIATETRPDIGTDTQTWGALSAVGKTLKTVVIV